MTVTETDRQVKTTIFKFLTDDLKIEMTEESKRYFESHSLSDIALTSTVIVNGYTVNEQCDMIAMMKGRHSLQKNSFFLKYIVGVLNRTYRSLHIIFEQYKEFLLFYYADQLKQVKGDIVIFMRNVSDVNLVRQTHEASQQLNTLIHRLTIEEFNPVVLDQFVTNEILPLCHTTVPTQIHSYLTLIYRLCSCDEDSDDEDSDEEDSDEEDSRQQQQEKKKKRRCVPFCILCCTKKEKQKEKQKAKQKAKQKEKHEVAQSSGQTTTVVTPLAMLTTTFMAIPYVQGFVDTSEKTVSFPPKTYSITAVSPLHIRYPEMNVVSPIYPICRPAEIVNYTLSCPTMYESQPKENMMGRVKNILSSIPQVGGNIVHGTANAAKHVAKSVHDATGSVQVFLTRNELFIRLVSSFMTATGYIMAQRVWNRDTRPIRAAEVIMDMSGIPRPVADIVSAYQQFEYMHHQLSDLNVQQNPHMVNVPLNSPHQTFQSVQNENLMRRILTTGSKLGGSAKPTNTDDLRQKRMEFYTSTTSSSSSTS